MSLLVIPALKHRILERHPPLPREIKLLDFLHDTANRESLLRRHHLSPLFCYRIMQTDRQMALALLQESDHTRYQADRRDGDTLRAPCIAIIGAKDLEHAQHIIRIVEGLTHSHEDNIGQLLRLRNGLYLIQDIRGGQLSMESLHASRTELATHLATNLRRDAQGEAVPVREAAEKLNRKQMILLGVETHVCVLQTAFDALKLGYEVYLAEDCTDSRHDFDRAAGIALMRENGVKVVTGEMLLFQLMHDSRHPVFKTISKLVR